MDSREQFIENGKRAQDLLKDEVLQGAFADVRQQYRDVMENGKTTQERETAWTRFHALKDVVTRLEVAVGRGTVAQAELERQAARENQ